MIDLRPVAYVIGLLVAVLGMLMLVPMALDLSDGNHNWRAMLASAVVVTVAGALVAIATRNSLSGAITLRQSFVLTTAVWTVVPLAGAVPLMMGTVGTVAAGMSLTDAYFEAMSGLTTTGASVIIGLGDTARGILLWRAMLNWLGGLGIVIVVMIFLPVMRVGGMQFFRAEGFDTLGKVLPRARDIASVLLWAYVLLTVACALAYVAVGIPVFDAICHALSTIATGGFSSRDAGFADFAGNPEYVSTLFMFLASLPYIRFVQMTATGPSAIWRDSQVRAYFRYCVLGITIVVIWRLWNDQGSVIDVLRTSAFNTIAVISSTGFSTNYLPDWGPPALVVVFVMGFMGACTGSSAAGLGVFRVQLVVIVARNAVMQILSPSRVVVLRYDGRQVEADVISQVMAFVSFYILLTGLITVGLSLTGMDTETAIFAAWTSIGNIGAVLGPGVMPSMTMHDIPGAAKWLMIIAMMLGRLGILSVLVLFLPRFWRG